MGIGDWGLGIGDWVNGQKLNANVPYHLKAGDGFYAGDKANAFRVELG